jgi:hypothetical protein
MNTPHNQSSLIVLKKGLPNQLYVLNDENKQEIDLVLENGKWQSTTSILNLSMAPFLFWGSVLVLLLSIILLFRRFKPTFSSKTILLLLFVSTATFAQNNKQNIRGNMTDKLF